MTTVEALNPLSASSSVLLFIDLYCFVLFCVFVVRCLFAVVVDIACLFICLLVLVLVAVLAVVV